MNSKIKLYTFFRPDGKVNRVVEKMEPTNVVSTPDLYISESDDENVGQESTNGIM